MDVLDGDLEAVESAGFRDLNFFHETDPQIFIDDAVRGSKESQDVRNEMLLVIGQRLPVLDVAAQIDFFGCSERLRKEGNQCNSLRPDMVVVTTRKGKVMLTTVGAPGGLIMQGHHRTCPK
jgi:hypothetical protein